MKKRLLFISANRVGDAVLSTGILSHLIEKNPGISVTIVCGPAAAGLFEAVPGLERLIVLTKKRMSLHWLTMWRQCIFRHWDILVDLRNTPFSYFLLTSNGYHYGRDDGTEHRVVRCARVLGLQDAPPMPRLWDLPCHENTARELIPNGVPVIAMAPAANWHLKTWPAQNFVELAKRLTAEDGILPGAKIALFAHHSERHLTEPVANGLPNSQVLDLVGSLSLLEVYACFKRCRFFIGNDSGLMHMAAASGNPTLGLFGPSRIDLYSPWGLKTGVASTGKPFKDHFPENQSWREADTLMHDLTVDAAEHAVQEIWNKAEVQNND